MRDISMQLRDEDFRSEGFAMKAESLELIVGSFESPGFRGFLKATDFQNLCRLEGATIDEVLLGLLPVSILFSQPPISGFRVGALALGSSGAVYLGANLEYSGCPLSWTIHAEQSATIMAWIHGESSIDRLAITAVPCGHCRQFLTELSLDPDLKILVPSLAGKSSTPSRLSELLPHAFGPSDLGLRARPFDEPDRRQGLRSEHSQTPEKLAVEAAARSYSPYTSARAGLCLEFENGRHVTGSCFENAAYNPSLSPLQTAWISMVMQGLTSTTIRSATLAEDSGAKIRYREATRWWLEQQGSAVDFRWLDTASFDSGPKTRRP